MSTNKRQVGGNHYKTGKHEHWDYVEANRLRYTEGCATKYVARSRKKHDNPKQDIEKALHYVEKIQELHHNGLLWPRPAPVVIGPEEFAESNALTEDEAEVIRLLTFWESGADLCAVADLLRRMLENAQ